ncbi:hypothetical protein D3C85_1852670 [compost metagenome]
MSAGNKRSVHPGLADLLLALSTAAGNFSLSTFTCSEKYITPERLTEQTTAVADELLVATKATDYLAMNGIHI